MSRLKHAIETARTEGIDTAVSKIRRRLRQSVEGPKYRRWLRENKTLSPADLAAIADEIAEFAWQQKISVLMPVYDPQPAFLREAIASVTAQLYPNWQLCMADDHSTNPEIADILRQAEAADDRVKVIYRTENGHISRASNSALELVEGDLIALLDHDDKLAPEALFMLAKAVNKYPDAAIIYSDEDRIDARGRRSWPAFKPGFSPQRLLSVNYTNHLTAYDASLVRELGGFRTGFEGSQDLDLMLRAIEKVRPQQVVHIPQILYHWRSTAGSVAHGSGAKSYAHERARAAINEHLERRGVSATASKGTFDLHRVIFDADLTPSVDLIFTRTPLGHASTVESVVAHTDYPCLSASQVGESPGGPVFELLDKTARASEADLLCFIDPSIELPDTGWLRELVGYASMADVGAAGPKIIGPRGKISSAGLVIAGENFLTRAYPNSDENDLGPDLGLSIVRNVSALPIDCMVIERTKFLAAGGFDHQDLPASLADVDLCLKLLRMGWPSVWTPWARVVQRVPGVGSAGAELKKLRSKWSFVFDRDPFYDPNLAEDGSFSLASEPRVGKLDL